MTERRVAIRLVERAPCGGESEVVKGAPPEAMRFSLEAVDAPHSPEGAT